MSGTNEVGPALTPEEWEKREAVRGQQRYWLDTPYGGTLGVGILSEDAEDNETVTAPEGRHLVAALCLYQQPFGFTHEDVRLLEQFAALAENAARWTEGGDVVSAQDTIIAAQQRSDAASLTRLASRIAALLPPQEER